MPVGASQDPGASGKPTKSCRIRCRPRSRPIRAVRAPHQRACRQWGRDVERLCMDPRGAGGCTAGSPVRGRREQSGESDRSGSRRHSRFGCHPLGIAGEDALRMKIAIIGARCDWRIRRGAARACRRGCDFHRARREPRGAQDAGHSAHHGRWQRAGRAARQSDRRLCGGGTAGHGGARHEGAPGRGGCRRRAEAALGPDTVVVPMQNGIPFLVFSRAWRRARGHAGHQRRSERGDRQNIPCERVIGCVVYPATEAARRPG